MTSIHHHPDESTLISYAAGALPESFETLVRCHLLHCAKCQQKVFEAEAIAGQLLDHARVDMSAGLAAHHSTQRDAFMSALTREDSLPQPSATADPTSIASLPAEVRMVLAGGEQELPWRRLVPGMHSLNINCSDGGLKLLRISPGRDLPIHSHQGSELTLVLQGAFQDELGCFYPGDVADLDHDVEHQPMTLGSEACICLVAMDAPLAFRSLVPKLLQPFIGF